MSTDAERDDLVFEQRRRTVAEQVFLLVDEAEGPGSRDHVSGKIRAVIAAEKVGDPHVLRAAVMELSAAASLWCLGIDILHPEPAFAKMQRRTPGPGRRD